MRRQVVLAAGAAVAVITGATAFAVVGGDDEAVGDQVASADTATDDGEGEGADADDAADEASAEQERREAERREREEAEERERQEAEERERQEAEERERAEAEERERREAEERERREAEERAAAEAQQRLDVQQRLVDLGYLVGAVDGEYGQQTIAAVMAFQAVNGLSVDGTVGPQTLAALDDPREPSLRGGPSNRIEVDIDRQILHLVEGDRRITTMKMSSGRGGTFTSDAGEVLRAETPVGTFTIDRRIRGEHQSSYGIGGMWDPMYFHGPWAIHGSPNVPAGPASAGCVRVSMADGRWLFDRVSNGTVVVLYGSLNTFTI